jgi:hypothetical protein
MARVGGMKTTPRPWAFLVFAAALLAGCSSSQVAEEPPGRSLGTVGIAGNGIMPPMGVLQSQLRDAAVRKFGYAENEIALGWVDTNGSQEIGRHSVTSGPNDMGRRADDGPWLGVGGADAANQGWSASAEVFLKETPRLSYQIEGVEYPDSSPAGKPKQ